MSQLSRDYTPDNVVVSDHPDENAEFVKIRARYNEMYTFWSGIHQEALEDDKFVAGDQWPDIVRKEREEEHRPILTYNLLPAFTRQIINKVRQERPQLRVKPVESDRHQTPDVKNVQGTKDYSLADVYMGIVRNIEHLSRAAQAYDTALMHAVNHGFGYIMLNTRYCRHDPFVQELVVERVPNAYTIFLDPGAREADYSDAQDAFVFSTITKEAFQEKYPDAQLGSFDVGAEGTLFEGWYDKDSLKIATYYWVDWKDDEVIKLTNGTIHYLSEVKDVLDEMKRDSGIYITKDETGEEMRRKVKRPVVMWRKMTGAQWLTDPVETVFEKIPIFPVLGDEMIVDGRVMYQSAIRDARDAQRSYNYWRTAAVETVALAPKAPWLVTPQQISGWEAKWESANFANEPYLPYNHIDGQNPPQRQFPSQPAAAELAQATQDSEDIRNIIGLHEADLGAPSNERSGKAILARQQKGAIGTYTFPANLNRALEAMGRVMVQAIPKIYDSERVVRVRLPDDTEDFVELNKTIRDEQTNKMHLVHDLGYGKYDVVVETGPSYATQRQEAVEAMLELLGTLPDQAKAAVTHLIVKEMGFPGADKVSAILRKMIPDELKSEDDRAADLPKGVEFDDNGEMVNEDGTPYEPPLSPEAQVQQQTNQIEQAKVEAEMQKHQATTAKAQADMVEAQAKIAEVQAAGAETGMDPEQAVQSEGEMLSNMERIIMEAMDRHEENPRAHVEAIEEAVAQGVVDALKRVKSYTDKRVGAVERIAETASRIPGGPTNGAAATRGPAVGATSATLPVQVTVENEAAPKPIAIEFETDDSGVITTAIPKYEKEKA